MLSFLAAAALQTCVIVFATDRPSWEEIYWHEIAHCNGWQHPKKAAPRKGEDYQAYKPPRRFRRFPSMPVVTHAVTTEEAKELCDGHWGCQWFEDQ
jgi:predicted SprT family Zn-dependent metalloprotease